MNTNLKRYLYLLLTFVCIFVFANICLSQDNYSDSLSFAQISDVHFDLNKPDLKARMYAESDKLLDDAVKQINRDTDLNFVMFSGDMINRPEEKLLLKFIKHANKLDVPWYAAAGNHDIGINGGLSKDQFVLLLNSHNPKFRAEKTYYSFIPKKGFKVIVLDTIIDDEVTANGRFSEEEFKWLEGELDRSKSDKIIIFEHHPVVEPFPSESHRMLNADCFMDLIKKHKNVVGVFSGHYHGARVNTIDGILHVSTPSLVQYPNAFRLVTITKTKKGVTVDLKYVETGLKEIQSKSRLMSLSGEMLNGAPEDRETTIELDK